MDFWVGRCKTAGFERERETETDRKSAHCSAKFAKGHSSIMDYFAGILNRRLFEAEVCSLRACLARQSWAVGEPRFCFVFCLSVFRLLF